MGPRASVKFSPPSSIWAAGVTSSSSRISTGEGGVGDAKDAKVAGGVVGTSTFTCSSSADTSNSSCRPIVSRRTRITLVGMVLLTLVIQSTGSTLSQGRSGSMGVLGMAKEVASGLREEAWVGDRSDGVELGAVGVKVEEAREVCSGF